MTKKRRAPEEEQHTDETWLIPYADLLTLLLALFIVLFAASQVDEGKFDQISRALNGAFTGGFSIFQSTDIIPIDDSVEVHRENEVWREYDERATATNEELLERMLQETADLEALQKQMDQYIVDNGLVESLETHLNHQQLMITISDLALYTPGSANVKADALALASSIAEMIRQYPQYEIKIAGHTDDVPMNTAEFPSNWDLSSKRALNFMKILLDGEENPGRFSAIGYGEYRPIATNETVDGRTQNRRVEVSIMRTITEGVSLELE